MIARKSLFIAISSFLLRFVSWIEFIIIVKLWGDFAPEALGIIGFTMSFLALFSIVADLGFNAAHIKRISEGRDLGTCIGTFATIKIILTGLMTAIALITIFILKITAHEEFYDTTTESIIFIFLIFNIISNLLSIPIITFTGKKEMVKREFPFIIGRIIGLPFVVLVAIAGVSIAGISPAFIWPSYLQSLQQFIADHAVESLAAIYLISWIATFLIGMWFLRKYPLKKPSWKLFKSYFSFAMPMMFLPIIGIISQNVGMLMIGYFWSSVEVGYYFTMVAVVGIVTVFPASVSAVLFPSISEYCSNKNFDKIKQTTHLAERYISMITIPILIGIMVLANPLINIVMSDAFLPAASVLIILAVFISISCLNSPYSSLIKGMDKPSILTKIGIATCLISIILNYLFIPKDGLLSSFGINGAAGAAGATVISALVGFILLRIAVKKLTGINILQSHTPRHIIAGLIAGIILYCLAFRASFFPSIYWYHLLMFIGVGTVSYLGILIVLKEFNKQDLDFFLDLLRPKKMLKYVSSELKEKPRKPN